MIMMQAMIMCRGSPGRRGAARELALTIRGLSVAAATLAG
jgi:hypothetical protein